MAELGSTNIYGDLNVKNNNIKQVGKINNVTDAELANLEGSTSNIQAQLNGKASNTISITAGNGLSGGGTLSATRTITLGTPSTITSATTNSVTATSHTHALNLTKADIVALGIPAQDTVYTHPATHPASMITESTSRRFVSDTEKALWNSKAEISDIPTKVGQLENDKNYVTQSDLGNAGYGDMMKSIYDKNNNGIVDNAEKVNGFTVGTNVPANAKFTDTVTTINGKTGAITKADIVALGIPAQDTNTTYSEITTAEIDAGTASTLRTITARRAKYIMDKVKSDFPTSLPANGGNADTAKHLIGDDTRSINSPPSEYMSGGSRYIGRAGWQTEFKYITTLGAGSFLSGTYCFLETKTPWSDPSGGYPIQIAYGNGNPVWRVGTSNTTWGEWQSFSKSLHIGTSAPSNRNIGWVDTSL